MWTEGSYYSPWLLQGLAGMFDIEESLLAQRTSKMIWELYRNTGYRGLCLEYFGEGGDRLAQPSAEPNGIYP